jgi:hypothetical protein
VGKEINEGKGKKKKNSEQIELYTERFKVFVG